MVGHSLGGYTAAAVLGARIDAGKLHRYGRSMGEHVGYFEFGGQYGAGAPVRATILTEALAFFREQLD